MGGFGRDHRTPVRDAVPALPGRRVEGAAPGRTAVRSEPFDAVRVVQAVAGDLGVPPFGAVRALPGRRMMRQEFAAQKR